MVKIKRKEEKEFSTLADKLGTIITISGDLTENGIEYQAITNDDLQVVTKVSINTILDNISSEVNETIKNSKHNILFLEVSKDDQLEINGGVVNVNQVQKKEYTPKIQEDFLIVSKEIETSPTDKLKKYQYTAYISKDIRSKQQIDEKQLPILVWQALDGNYSANNVYLTKEFNLGGNYKEVGNFNKGSVDATGMTGKNGIPSVKGKNIEEFLNDLFSKTVQPTKYPGGTYAISPNCSISLLEARSYEAGTTITPHYSIAFNDGSYDLSNTKKQMANCQANTYKVTSSLGGETKTTKSGELSKITVKDGMNYNLTAIVGYSQGNIALDNFGENSNPIIRYESGETTSKSQSITSFRRAFVSTFNDIDAEVNSKSIRDNNKASETAHSDSSSFTVSIPKGTKKVILATQKNSIVSITDSAALNAEIKSMFVKQGSQIPINGLNDFSPINYNYWVFKAPSGLNNTNYKITLS